MSCSQEHVAGTMDTILSRVTVLLNRPPELSGNPIASSSNKAGATGEVNDEFCLRNYLFHCPKGFYFPSERRRAADLYRPRPGLNSRTLGPMASTLTTRPPRTTTETWHPGLYLTQWTGVCHLTPLWNEYFGKVSDRTLTHSRHNPKRLFWLFVVFGIVPWRHQKSGRVSRGSFVTRR
jgi:hypothetical protein